MDDIDAIVAQVEGIEVKGKAKNKKKNKKNQEEKKEAENGVKEQNGDHKEENGDKEEGENGADDKKKRKRNRQKKKKEDGATNGETVATGKAKGKKTEQTVPPTVPISDLYPSGQFPVGQIMEYADVTVDGRTAKERFGTEEKRAMDRMQIDMYNEVRQAAEAHRQTRYIIKCILKLWQYLN